MFSISRRMDNEHGHQINPIIEPYLHRKYHPDWGYRYVIMSHQKTWHRVVGSQYDIIQFPITITQNKHKIKSVSPPLPEETQPCPSHPHPEDEHKGHPHHKHDHPIHYRKMSTTTDKIGVHHNTPVPSTVRKTGTKDHHTTKTRPSHPLTEDGHNKPILGIHHPTAQ